jgi:4-hydroxybutyrate CoA-transferase
MPGRVRIKYCGGCNPRYDRTGLAARLRADFPELDMPETGEGGGPYDFVAVICGCPAACAEHEGLEGKAGKMLIVSAGEYGALAAALREKLG